MVNPDAVRGQVLLEESREAVVVLDANGIVVTASRRARQSLGVREGEQLSPELLESERTLVVPYDVDGRPERLVYLSEAGDLAAYEELRSGFTAAVSHELRTPLARLLSLLELAGLPGEDVADLVEQARGEIDADPGADRRGALPRRARVGDAGRVARRRAGAAGAARGRRRARGAGRPRRRRAARRGRGRRDRRGAAADAAASSRRISPRTRSATPGRARTRRCPSGARTARPCCSVVDDGAGVEQADLPRLFERFYRADRSRASRGTGLGLAIVKHVVASAGGTVEARGGRGRGLEIRCVFPTRVVARSPPFHRIFTSRQPRRAEGGRKTRRMTIKRETITRIALLARPARAARRLRRRAAAATTTRPATTDRGVGRGQRPLRPDRGRRLEHGRPVHDRRRRALPAGEPRRAGDGRRLRHRRRLRALLPRRDRPLERLPPDQGRGGRDLRGRGDRVRRVPGRERRAHGRRQHGERLGRPASPSSSSGRSGARTRR